MIINCTVRLTTKIEFDLEKVITPNLIVKNTAMFWIDDIWVTGYLADKLQIRHLDLLNKVGMYMTFYSTTP